LRGIVPFRSRAGDTGQGGRTRGPRRKPCRGSKRKGWTRRRCAATCRRSPMRAAARSASRWTAGRGGPLRGRRGEGRRGGGDPPAARDGPGRRHAHGGQSATANAVAEKVGISGDRGGAPGPEGGRDPHAAGEGRVVAMVGTGSTTPRRLRRPTSASRWAPARTSPWKRGPGADGGELQGWPTPSP